MSQLSLPHTSYSPTAGSLDRRNFLQGALAAGGLAMLPAVFARQAAAAPLGPNERVLIVFVLGGGNDGLNMISPATSGYYQDARGALAISPSAGLAIDGGLFVHPSMSNLHRRYQAGDVAVVQGVGDPVDDHSHFSSMARWMAGGADNSGFHSGWLGRYIDGLPGGDDPFHAVSIGSSIPLVVQGRNRQASGLPAEANGIFQVAGADGTYRRQYEALAAFGNGSTGRGALADSLADSGRRAVDLAATIEPVYADEPPVGELKKQLDLCARLINANVGIRVLSVTYGDFDSHAGQQEMHDARMAELNEGLLAFNAKLDPAYRARTLILTVSEFGRRIKANRSGGTDHGAASTLLAIGTQVKGGFYGELPSLANPDRQGNLVPTVDYRSVYASVLDGWLRADSTEILGGGHENLGFVAAPAPARTTGGLDPTITNPTFTYRAQIIRLYRAFFGRLPDSSGLDHWVDARRSGASLIAVADVFASSTEFANRYGNLANRAFIDLVYRNVLGRPADAEGARYWTSLLDAGTGRGHVMIGFSESSESVDRRAADVDHVNRSGPIARLYLAYFQRAGDDEGLLHWIGSGLSYRAVSDAFVESGEFRQRYGSLGDAAFVDLVYRNVLGRSPDAGGRQYWIDRLAQGTARGQVMLEFAQSTEFVARTGTIA